MRYLFSLLIVFFAAGYLSAQITTNPALPVASQSVSITFDSSKDGRLGKYTGTLYAHTGVSIQGKGDWKNVIGNWGQNAVQPQLTHTGDGIYTLEISPSINSFYSVTSGDVVTRMSFVFRSADGSQQTNDLFVDVFEEGLAVSITSPANQTMVAVNDTVTFAATASEEAALSLFVDETSIAQSTATSISAKHVFTASGNYKLIAEAVGTTTVRDTVQITVRPEIVEETKPANYHKGINYTSDNSAALVLWAPLKQVVYVLGDFNNWQISNDYLMKKDGDYFWLDIPNLEAGTEYAFQYLIDGNIKIADPYTEKILDAQNDPYISEATYPNLKAYPEGKTEGIVSVLQTAQTAYSWEVSDFQMPEKNKMVIYEVLIRDFTTEHTYASVVNKLDYLEELGVNVLELMPVNEFEGNNSWGYNPSFYFAPDKYYGPKNELKRLIDECHKRGMAVVIDMVLNHSYGQSPFVQMYMDNWTILPENPWYNVNSPNPVFSWGYDFNHEAKAVEELVDSVNAFWMSEYKVDGFRFDFTKGFTNTAGDGSAYDMGRIQNLKRMADEIWERNADALVILEHLTGNTEEKALADYGMMLWGNMNHNYSEAAMGYHDNQKSNLAWGIYTNRGWAQPNLVSYMESHDEERVAYRCLNFGDSNGGYNTRDLNTALKRIEMNALFFLPLPGPKMIWQFGELGYDYSINNCEDGTINEACRTAPKPLVWDYLENDNRRHLRDVMGELAQLKQSYPEFYAAENTSYSVTNPQKWYSLSDNNEQVLAMGNFEVVSADINVTFPETGKYYEFFTGDSITISSAQQSFSLNAGEYRLYTTRKLKSSNIPTDVTVITKDDNKVSIYPNPTSGWLNVRSDETIEQVEVYTLDGKMILQQQPKTLEFRMQTEGLHPGIHVVKIATCTGVISQKVIVGN